MGVKIIFTTFVLVVGVAICFVDPNANNAGPDWFWGLGKNDPVRNLMCRPDGSLRRYTKLGIFVWFGVFLLILWLLLPDE